MSISGQKQNYHHYSFFIINYSLFIIHLFSTFYLLHTTLKIMPSIIATLGPASTSKDMIHALHQAGVKIFRFNFAHDTEESTKTTFQRIHELEQETGQTFSTLIDLEGPGISTGALTTPKIYTKDQIFRIYTEEKGVGETDLSCDYPALSELAPGSIIKIDAGLFQVEVISHGPNYVEVKALNNFTVGSRRHINLPGTHVKLPSFTDKDRRNALYAIQQGCSYVALSFVRSGEDIKDLRRYLNEHDGQHVRIVAKIENEE